MRNEWWPHLFSWPHPLDLVSWLWLSSKGYALTSSIGIGWVVFLAAYAHKHNCHHHRCPWMGRHIHPDHGLLCRKHFLKAGGQIPGKHYSL